MVVSNTSSGITRLKLRESRVIRCKLTSLPLHPLLKNCESTWQSGMPSVSRSSCTMNFSVLSTCSLRLVLARVRNNNNNNTTQHNTTPPHHTTPHHTPLSTSHPWVRLCCTLGPLWADFKSKLLTFEISNVNYSFFGGLRGFLCDFKSNNLLLIGLIVILHGFFSKTSTFITFKNKTFQSVVGGSG